MIVMKERWSATCDCCGSDLQPKFETALALANAMKSCNWKNLGNENVVCWQCWEHYEAVNAIIQTNNPVLALLTKDFPKKESEA